MSSKGFSLVEVLVAVLMMSVSLLALYAAMTYGVRANHHGLLLSEATNAGREILSLVKGRGWAGDPNLQSVLNDPVDARLSLNAPPFEEDLAAYASSRLKRNLSVRRLAPVGTFEHELVSLKVVIYWDEGRRQNSLPLETYSRL
ncbi:prepilin-type N-terminal cleavage/methylation domain-containing protein [bacterium]|nr:prepilin-type N-terminal cleavage/methylation domain-containing protein [bacterium]